MSCIPAIQSKPSNNIKLLTIQTYRNSINIHTSFLSCKQHFGYNIYKDYY